MKTSPVFAFIEGAGTRTQDTRLKRPLLCRLSYAPCEAGSPVTQERPPGATSGHLREAVILFAAPTSINCPRLLGFGRGKATLLGDGSVRLYLERPRFPGNQLLDEPVIHEQDNRPGTRTGNGMTARPLRTPAPASCPPTMTPRPTNQRTVFSRASTGAGPGILAATSIGTSRITWLTCPAEAPLEDAEVDHIDIAVFVEVGPLTGCRLAVGNRGA